MPTLESRIDELYKGSLGEFVAARTALAKTLTGDEARRVKSLSKPTVVPWAVNQVHWHARDVYGRVTKAGDKLREVQLAALKGRAADVRGATLAHRQAVGEAVKAAVRLASEAGVRPDAEPLARMFEAVSLQKDPPEPHGRFTKPIQPQGFEALAGVTITPASHPAAAKTSRSDAQAPPVHAPIPDTRSRAAREKEIRRREEEEAAAAHRKQAAVKKAEAELDRARSEEEQARAAWDRSKKHLADAEHALNVVRG